MAFVLLIKNHLGYLKDLTGVALGEGLIISSVLFLNAQKLEPELAASSVEGGVGRKIKSEQGSIAAVLLSPNLRQQAGA